MQTAGGGFAAAVTAQDQLVDFNVTVNLPAAVPSYKEDLTKCVVSININRAVVTNLPDGTTLISGYPSAAMTVVLSGLLNQAAGVPLVEADNVYRLFNPNDPASVMWRTTRGGLPITVKAGLWDGAASADLVTQYTGTIDQVTCSNGVVTLVCRDQRSTVTNQAVLPPVITPAPYNSGLTSEYAIDYLLRHSSPQAYYSWPAQRPNCILAAGMRSSIWPEVGSFASSSNTPTFLPGAHGSAVTAQSTSVHYTLQDPNGTPHPILPTDTSFFMEYSAGEGSEFWVQDPGGTQYVVIAYENDGNLHFFTQTASGTTTQTVALAAGIHYVAAQVHWTAGSTAVTGTLYTDSTSTALSITAKDARSNSAQFTLGAATAGATGSMAELQVSIESAGVSNGSFVPTLILDPSLNSLTALPDVSGKDTWTVLQDIAAAEGGVIGFDELGVCRFVNRDSITGKTSSRSITSAASLMSLDSLEQMSLCATHIQVPVNQLQITAPETVWSASSTIIVNGYSSTTFVATTSSPVVNVATTDSGFMPVSPTPGLTYWRASGLPDGSAFGTATGVSVTVEPLSSTALSVTVTNANPFALYMVNPVGWPGTEGSAALVIGGQAVTSTGVAPDGSTSTGTVYADAQWPPLSAGGAVSNTQFGEILLQLASNPWVQDLGSAQSLATDLIGDLHYPKPLFRNMNIVADPRLQLLDRVTLVDPDVSQINDDALIVGITTRLSAGEWTQTIDARAWFRPGAWILGKAGHSELGLTTFLY